MYGTHTHSSSSQSWAKAVSVAARLAAADVRRLRRLPHVVVAAGKRLETPLVRGLVHKVSNKLGPLDYGSFMPLMFWMLAYIANAAWLPLALLR